MAIYHVRQLKHRNVVIILSFLVIFVFQRQQLLRFPINSSLSDNRIVSLKDLPDLKQAYTQVRDGNHSMALYLIQNNAGLKVSQDVIDILPDNNEIEQLYGKQGATIIGLDTCERFRSTYLPHERHVGIAGQMNSGTNAAGKLLRDNFMNNNNNVHAIVPWNKHSWASLRGVYHFSNVNNATHDQFLPIIVVRDPYFWMKSMCESPYTMQWDHDTSLCPNLQTNVSISWGGKKYRKDYQSLAHVWNEWYREYLEADFPRLIVRFEDLLFWHTDTVLREIAQCVGNVDYQSPPILTTAPMKQGEYYERIKTQSSWLSALIKTNGDRSLNDQDMKLAKEYLDTDLMKLLHYKVL